jgi:hypothetical protein
MTTGGGQIYPQPGPAAWLGVGDCVLGIILGMMSGILRATLRIG